MFSRNIVWMRILLASQDTLLLVTEMMRTCVYVCACICVCARVCVCVCAHVFGHLSDSFILDSTWELLCNYHIPMDEHSYLFTSGYAKVVLSLLYACKDITLYLK